MCRQNEHERVPGRKSARLLDFNPSHASAIGGSERKAQGRKQQEWKDAKYFSKFHAVLETSSNINSVGKWGKSMK